jgi:hypothetical protein
MIERHGRGSGLLNKIDKRTPLRQPKLVQVPTDHLLLGIGSMKAGAQVALLTRLRGRVGLGALHIQLAAVICLF